MPRNKIPRFVSGYPMSSALVPEDRVPTGEILLPVEGVEAIRLSDFEKLDQATAADIMGVSRQTYGRILGEARAIIADALITNKTLRIGGGVYEMRGGQGQCRRRRRCGRR
ncbi:MAG: DUF134 domain-containing protein [Thermodesulfobacteriota bacterium]